MREYGKEVTYEHICAFLPLALNESEQSVSCFSTVLLGGNITDIYWVCSVDAGARFDKYVQEKKKHPPPPVIQSIA